MKRHPQFAFLSSSGLVVLIVLLVLSYQLALLVRTPDHQWLTVTKSEAQQVQCSDPTKPLTEWREVRLPHWENGIEMGLHCLRMRTTLTGEQLSASHGLPKLLVNTLGGLGRVWLNGEVIDDIIHSTSDRQVIWFRPYAIAIPNHLLRDSNDLMLDYYIHKPTLNISPFYIGTEPLKQAA
jgi:hypothetical protein